MQRENFIEESVSTKDSSSVETILPDSKLTPIDNVSEKADSDVVDINEIQLRLEDIGNSVSEAGRFSFASICTLALNYLFSEECNRKFCTKCIHLIVENLQLPLKVESMLNELICNNLTHPYEQYLVLLYEEPFFIENGGNLKPLIQDIITLAVRDGSYDARWRVLVHYLSFQIGIDSSEVREYEGNLVKHLLHYTVEQTQEEKNDERHRNVIRKTKRAAWIGLAAAGGGVLIGLTGGLAAPLIGAGLSTIVGSSAVFGAIGSTAGVAVVGSLFGVAGGGLTGYKMHKRVGDIEEFEFHILDPLMQMQSSDINNSKASGGSGNSNNNHNKNSKNYNNNNNDDDLVTDTVICVKQLHITIVVSGWIKDKSDDNYVRPWLGVMLSKEQYYLRYESSYLLELGQAMNYLVSCVASAAAQETLKYTVLSGLMGAVAWPAWLMGLSSVIDNPWGVCLRRSAQVGKQLAEILLARNHGNRPVTLLGYSLGARVIFYCLREMSGRKSCEGIIQDVILIGAPCTGNIDDWRKFTRVVAGRIVNGYCKGDWLLKFLYRTLSIAVHGVAGLQPIELNDRRMQNVDLTDLVLGHSEYPEKMHEILLRVGVTVVPPSSSS